MNTLCLNFFFRISFICFVALFVFYSSSVTQRIMIDSEEDYQMDDSDPCSTNKITILLAGFLSASLILFSMIPCFCGGYERTPSRGWLTSSLVVAYITYLTFSAVFAQVNIDIVARYGENGEFTYPDGSVVTEAGFKTSNFSIRKHHSDWFIRMLSFNWSVGCGKLIDLLETHYKCIETCFSLSDTIYDFLLDTRFEETAEALNTPCGKSSDIETIISTFQRIYNALAVVVALLLTIYSAMNSSNITSKHI